MTLPGTTPPLAGFCLATVHLDDLLGPYDAVVELAALRTGAIVPHFTRATAQFVADRCHALHLEDLAHTDGRNLCADLYFDADTLVIAEFPDGRDGAASRERVSPGQHRLYRIGGRAWRWGATDHEAYTIEEL